MKAIELVNADWRKSSRSSGTGQCIEVARNLPGAVAVRDSKDAAGPALATDPAGWQAFTAAVKSGALDR